MRIIIQRVNSAKLTSGGQLVSEIGKGLMVLVGITHGDNELDIDNLTPKLLNLRLWGEGDKSWCKSLKEMDYQILLVSQFTLYH